MFTGLIREVGRIEAIARRGSITVVGLAAPHCAPGLAVGDSLAVNGICLTVTRTSGAHVRVEATEETRRVTTLASWRPGGLVHLEPALRAGDPLGGHFVLGHVDGVGRVSGFERHGGSARMTIALDASLAALLVPKGSIAVDGVSLTLDAGPLVSSFSITLVPHTLAVTRFGAVSIGGRVNLELDVLAKAATGARQATEATRGTGGPRRSEQPAMPPLTLASLRTRGWQRRSSR